MPAANDTKHKSALVTGATSGIGLATVRLLRDRGYTVTIVGRRHDAVAAIADRFEVEGLVVDLGLPDAVDRLRHVWADRSLDALVNNAAIVIPGNLEDALSGDLGAQMSTNLEGPLRLIAACLPALRRACGAITNVTSAIVERARPQCSAYAASKGALAAATRALAIDLAPSHVRVNAVSPGAIDTPMLAGLRPDPEARRASIAHLEGHVIPMGRLGRPEEVAHVIAAQLESTYTTGAVWSCDGGVGAT